MKVNDSSRPKSTDIPIEDAEGGMNVPPGDSSEDRIKKVVGDFALRSFKRIERLNANEILEENGINPLLIWALGINDFRSLAKFVVYQRIGRSLVTSFGQTVVEGIVRGASGGKRGTWWDVLKDGEENLYMCVKSGPADMDADQVRYFSQKAKEVMKRDKKALPVIAMSYGRKIWSVITDTLKRNGLDPNRHTLIGKKLFDKISDDPDFHSKLPNIVRTGAAASVGDKRIIEILESKIDEISNEFSGRFKNVDELLQYVLEPPIGNNNSNPSRGAKSLT